MGVEELWGGGDKGVEDEARKVVKSHEFGLYPEDGREPSGSVSKEGRRLQGLGRWQGTWR